MKVHLKINPSVAYRKKKGVYVVYLNFNFYFFRQEAALLFDRLFAEGYETLPESFVAFLVDKQILMEGRK